MAGRQLPSRPGSTPLSPAQHKISQNPKKSRIPKCCAVGCQLSLCSDASCHRTRPGSTLVPSQNSPKTRRTIQLPVDIEAEQHCQVLQFCLAAQASSLSRLMTHKNFFEPGQSRCKIFSEEKSKCQNRAGMRSDACEKILVISRKNCGNLQQRGFIICNLPVLHV